MAIPTVIRLLPGGQPVGTPVEGPTGGRSLVEIYGDGFRLPPAAAPDGPSGPTQAGLVVAPSPKTVSVTFGGAEALEVLVIRSNLLHVINPISPLIAAAPTFGAGAVDVVITNLDDNGDPIGGETVTVVDGWTYRRPKLDAATESDLVRMVRAFVREWKRQVLPEVVFTSHTDFDADISTAFVDIAEMPAIVLNLNGLPENRFYSCNEGPEITVSAERVEKHRKPRTVDLNFEVIGISDNPMEILNLMAAATDFMERNPRIRLDREAGNPGAGTVEFELDYQPGASFDLGNRPSSSNIHFFSGSILIRGFSFEGLAAFPGDSIVALFRDLKDPVSLDVEPIA